MSNEPKRWTEQHLINDAETSKQRFRENRGGEPSYIWRTTYYQRRNSVRQAFKVLNLRQPKLPHSRVVAALHSAGLIEVLRYMLAPPISEDDLKVIADIRLSRSALSKPPHARSLLRALLSSLDRVRFPWIIHGAVPSRAEWKAAIGITAALMTNQAIATHRRNTGKRQQETAVLDFLKLIGLTQVTARKIQTLRDAPKPGEYCAESEVMGEKADIVVSLYDNRLLLIECKVSNSAVNSFKRVVHEAAGKAGYWTVQLGQGQVIAAAVLAGVFNPRNLLRAQSKNLTILWAHRLSDLADIINSTKPP